MVPGRRWDLEVGQRSEERQVDMMTKAEALLERIKEDEEKGEKEDTAKDQKIKPLYRVSSCWQVVGLDHQYQPYTGQGLVRFACIDRRPHN